MSSSATSHITNSKFFKTPPVPEEMFLLHLLPFPVRHHVAHKAQGDQERWENRFFLTFTSICRGSGPALNTKGKLLVMSLWFSSVQFSRSVVSDSSRPHELQHARPPCPSPTPGVHWDSCPSSQWCHPAISSSVVPFSSCPHSLPASESFPMNQLFA